MNQKLRIYLYKLIQSKLLNKKIINFDQIDQILKEISPTERVLSNLKRILENDYYLPIYIETPEIFLIYLEIILKIAAFSNYLTDIMVRNPEFLTRFLSSGELNKDFTYDDFNNELIQQIQIFSSFDKKIGSIRRFKRLHILRIGLRDILNFAEIEQTMAEYSFLTKSILDKTFQFAYESIRDQSTLEQIPDYALISLGKLGGNELNFSSDVDLICVYDNPIEKYSTDILEFYDRVIKQFIELCSNPKYGTPLYRIDFRLRPDGKFSPLARSISYYQLYYETYGRDWERQMLLKMNFVSGSEKLFKKFYRSLENFIFPRTFLEPPQIFIKRFRNMYLENKTFDTMKNSLNLKHFSGGIRDVEFSVQALQLIHGGTIKEIRTPNTINALKTLIDNKLIDSKTGIKIIDSYKILRRIENFIQLMDDLQIHILPTDKDKSENLIRYLKFKNKNEFQRHLNSIRNTILKFYNKTLQINKKNLKKDYSFKLNLRKNEEIFKRYLQIVQILEERLPKYSILNTNEEFDRLKIKLINFLNKSKQPLRLVQNLYKLILNINSTYQFRELISNENLLKIVIQIFEESEPLTQELVSNKKIIDYFFSGQLNWDIELPKDSKNYTDDIVRQFIFHVMFNFFTKLYDSEKVSRLLVAFIDNLIQNIAESLAGNYQVNNDSFAVIALGSYGNKEMHFKSDIDMLFIFSNKIDDSKAEKFSQRVLTEIRDKFKLYNFFQVDSKLRPEGSISKLSWTIEELEKYIKTRMRIWEFQSYTKMRLITGNQLLFEKLHSFLHSRVQQLDKSSFSEEIKKNLENIREQKILFIQNTLNPKTSKGGILDLQFLIQYFILINGFNKDFIGLDFSRSMNEIKLNEAGWNKINLTLKKNYKILFNLILTIEVITGKSNFDIARTFDSKYIRKSFRIKKSESIYDYLGKILQENIRLTRQLNTGIF